MDKVFQLIQLIYQRILEIGDKRTDPWLLVYSPAPVWLISLTYVCVVWAGPRLMKHRAPLDIKVVLVVYNCLMVCLSAYMFHEVFFILKKKNNQLTFLHIYHHTTVICNSWVGIKYSPGGQLFFTGMLNTFIHIVMYSYYGLAALGPGAKKHLWWKRHVTMLQLVQFVLRTIHTEYNLLADCDFPDSINAELFFFYCMNSNWQRVQSMYQWTLENGDKRTDPWLLVYSPAPVFLIILVYLCVVWAGPRLMKNRAPVDLKGVLFVYNLAMVCLSVYMFHEFVVTSRLSNYSYLCQPTDYSASPLSMRMANACWWFFLSKIIELSDTVFFILRKKNNQLSFLHIYHHTTMIFNTWAGVKYVPGGQSFFIGLLNSFVHVTMYSYYGLAGLGPHMQKYLWWKRYITTLQLFVVLIIHTTYNLFAECDFPDFMNVVMDTAWQHVQSAYRWTLENGDQRTDPWLLVYSPVPVVVIFLAYLCVLWAGPQLMKHRAPVELKGVLIVYNFAMVCLSVYMFHEFMVTSWLSNYSYLCQPVDYSTRPLAMRVQFVLLTTHTGYNLFTECDFPDSMNIVVFGYCVSLIILFSNFYYQSYVSKKAKRT
ncbi:hypothetical protein CRUP_020387 [Coryphaenoides rupestris]|nr:hypothetical protein CRUP_020387 [Coryphaenoides rupestris]